MQRDWDAELMEDRSFRMGGETFRWRELHYTEAAKFWETYTNPAENGDRSFLQDTEIAITAITDLLEPDDRAAFKKLVARKTNPVPRHQIMQLYHWLFSVVNGVLPTVEPAPSGTGAQGSKAGSSAGSSSKAATPTT